MNFMPFTDGERGRRRGGLEGGLLCRVISFNLAVMQNTPLVGDRRHGIAANPISHPLALEERPSASDGDRGAGHVAR